MNDKKRPLVVSYGMGVDSTAMLVGLAQRGIRPDLILFADTGGEKVQTYQYLETMNAWLRAHGMPEVTVLQYAARDFKNWPAYHTLEENCLTNGTLPSEAFGFGSCSMKWKQQPQNKFMKTWAPAVEAWKAGLKVRKAIGYDASPADQKRRCSADKITFKVNAADAKRYDFWYPLQEWGWTRLDCVREIAQAGLPVPVKSACFYCPNMTKQEVRELPANQLQRIVVMEARALPRLTKIEGLWRNGCKGTRGGDPKPGRMTTFIRDEQLLPAEEIARLEAVVPKEIVLRNEVKASGQEVPTWSEFFDMVGIKA
jgi:hypothetical protein